MGLVAACASAPRTPSTPAIDVARLDRIARDAVEHGGIVGMAVVVERGDTIVLARGYGVEDLETKRPVTPRTVFPLASLSKQYWATVALRHVERGVLALDAPIASVLPAFPDRRVTLAHLLQQTSGLGDDRPHEDDVRFTDLEPLAFAPGERWAYSNRGAILVRALVEQAAGKPWATMLADEVARPLGLEHTSVCAPGVHGYAARAAGAVPAALDDETLTRVQFTCADALDVARFERSFDRHELLSPASVAAMRTPVQLRAGDATVALDYGMLTRIGELAGHRAFGHTGNFPGVDVAAYRLPDDDLTIVVLENTTPRPGYKALAVAQTLARAILGIAEPQVRDLAVPADVLAACTGTFASATVEVRLTAKDGALWAELVRPAQWTGRLQYQGGDTFLGGPAGVRVDNVQRFVPARGKAMWVTWGSPWLLDGVAWRIAD